MAHEHTLEPAGSLASGILVFAGPACSGKSTLAELLSKEERIPHLAMDATRALLMPDSSHTRHDRRIAYRAMHWAAGLLAGCGAGVILDAPYGHRQDREDLERAASAAGAALYLVECRVAPALAAARFLSRDAGPRLDLTVEGVTAMAETYPYSGAGLTLDTSAAAPVCLALIREYLARGRPLRDGWSAGGTAD